MKGNSWGPPVLVGVKAFICINANMFIRNTGVFVVRVIRISNKTALRQIKITVNVQ